MDILFHTISTYFHTHNHIEHDHVRQILDTNRPPFSAAGASVQRVDTKFSGSRSHFWGQTKASSNRNLAMENQQFIYIYMYVYI